MNETKVINMYAIPRRLTCASTPGGASEAEDEQND